METERLLLRPFVVEDAEALHRGIYSDEQVVRWYSGLGVLSPKQTRQHVVDHLREWAESELGRHAVILKEGTDPGISWQFALEDLWIRRRVPAVDGQDLPGDKRGLVGGEE
jgi:RimJ/RimL family protein N-acetyltransferase